MFYVLTIAAMFFLAFGFLLFFIHIYYRVNGKETVGKVIAIEKYISTSGHGSEKTRSTLYRAVYEYYFNGQPIWFTGSGSGNINFNIGEKTPVLYLKHGPEYCQEKSNVYLIISSVFSLVGFGGIAIAWNNQETWVERLTPVAGLLFVAAIARQILISKGIWEKIVTGVLVNSQIVTAQSLEGREIYWNTLQLEREKGSVAKIGLVISSIFFLITSIASLIIWNQLPDSALSIIKDVLSQKISYEELVNYNGDPLMMGLGIAIIFTILSSYSLIFSFFKAARH